MARAVAWPAAGLLVWAAHFTVLYAGHAVACERGLAAHHWLGLPLVPAVVVAATAVALLLLGAIALRAAPAGVEGGEVEPRFTRWFAGAAAAMAGLAVIFQAVPALVLTACG
ncbi:hypothetical protein [Muricoccus radiodurans]|uniref:hypothetical protein n=1 Tax=Muricoccus radiodurans TaxID=2231721 RepID=UPI003CF2EDD7